MRNALLAELAPAVLWGSPVLHVVLRGLVLLEPFFALSAGSTIHHLVDHGADVVPAVVVRAVVVLPECAS